MDSHTGYWKYKVFLKYDIFDRVIGRSKVPQKKEKEERCSGAIFIGSCTDEFAISKKARFPGKEGVAPSKMFSDNLSPQKNVSLQKLLKVFFSDFTLYVTDK